MVPLTSPSRARNSSSLWASTSTMALPMPTTSMLACVIWLAKTPQGNPAATIAASSVPTRSETAISGSRTPEGIREGGFFAAPADAGRLGAAVHQHAKTFHAHVAPFLRFHLGARGVDPGHVLDAQLLVIDAGQKPGAPQDRVFVTQCPQL